MPHHDIVRVRHMVDAGRDLITFTKGRRREDLDTDRMLFYAVVHLIEIMGEAANRVSTDFKDEHPETPWSILISTRNRLIHGYNDLEKEIIWKTVTEDIPPVVEGLEAILGTEG